MAKSNATAKKPEVAAAPKSAPAAAKPAAAPVQKRKPTQDEIAKRAYEIYLRRGATAGNDMEDWMQAERELMAGK